MAVVVVAPPPSILSYGSTVIIGMVCTARSCSDGRMTDVLVCITIAKAITDCGLTVGVTDDVLIVGIVAPVT